MRPDWWWWCIPAHILEAAPPTQCPLEALGPAPLPGRLLRATLANIRPNLFWAFAQNTNAMAFSDHADRERAAAPGEQRGKSPLQAPGPEGGSGRRAARLSAAAAQTISCSRLQSVQIPHSSAVSRTVPSSGG